MNKCSRTAPLTWNIFFCIWDILQSAAKYRWPCMQALRRGWRRDLNGNPGGLGAGQESRMQGGVIDAIVDCNIDRWGKAVGWNNGVYRAYQNTIKEILVKLQQNTLNCPQQRCKEDFSTTDSTCYNERPCIGRAQNSAIMQLKKNSVIDQFSMCWIKTLKEYTFNK